MEFAVRSPRCEVDCLTYRGVWRREYLDILVVCIWSVPWPRTWPRRCTVYSVCRWVCWGGWRGGGPLEPRAVDTADDGDSCSFELLSKQNLSADPLRLLAGQDFRTGQASPWGAPGQSPGPGLYFRPTSTAYDPEVASKVNWFQMSSSNVIIHQVYLLCYSPQRPVQYLPFLQGSRRLPLLCSCQNAEQRIAYQPQPWSC